MKRIAVSILLVALSAGLSMPAKAQSTSTQNDGQAEKLAEKKQKALYKYQKQQQKAQQKAQRDADNLARNDAEHRGQPFGMTRRQSKEHALRFPDGLFVDDIDRDIARASPGDWPGRIVVTDAGLAEAIRRVETFCEFVDAQRSSSEFLARAHRTDSGV